MYLTSSIHGIRCFSDSLWFLLPLEEKHPRILDALLRNHALLGRSADSVLRDAAWKSTTAGVCAQRREDLALIFSLFPGKSARASESTLQHLATRHLGVTRCCRWLRRLVGPLQSRPFLGAKIGFPLFDFRSNLFVERRGRPPICGFVQHARSLRAWPDLDAEFLHGTNPCGSPALQHARFRLVIPS